jgi:hypothetical protein
MRPRAQITAQRAKGRYRIQVLSPAQEVVKDLGWHDNLILDQGLDQVATYAWCDCFLVCAVGTGNEPTEVDGGLSEISQATTTVTVETGVFTFDPSDVGSLLKWTSGEEALITGFVDSTHVSVSPSQTVAQDTFIMYRVGQTGLETEIKRSINASTKNPNFVTGAGNCGTTLVANTITCRRTWDFPAETGSATYAELGVSYSGQAGNNLFSRVVLDPDVSLTNGQILRVSYELQITMTPNTASALTANIAGWPISPAVNTDGDQSWQYVGLSSVALNGETDAYDDGGLCNEPAFAGGTSFALQTGRSIAPFTATTQVGGATMFLSNDGSPPAAFGSAVNRSAIRAVGNTSLSSYTNGTFIRDKQYTFGLTEANRVDWRAMGIGPTDPSPTGDDNETTEFSGFVFVFDDFQTKLNTYTLTLVFRYTWSRELS